MPLNSVWGKERCINLAKLVAEDVPKSIAPLKVHLSNGNDVGVCPTLVAKRLPNGFGDMKGLTSFEHLSVVLSYVYCDQVPEIDNVCVLVNVLDWALANSAPDRFVDLLMNELIRLVDFSNVVDARIIAKKQNSKHPTFMDFEAHCIAIMKDLSFNNMAYTIANFKKYPEIHTEILFESSHCQRLHSAIVDESTFQQDLQEMYTSNTGSLEIDLGDDRVVKLPPSVVAANSEYVWMLLSDTWSPSTGTVSLYPVDEHCDTEKASLRARSLEKLLQIWFAQKVELDIHEAMEMCDLCQFLLVDQYNPACVRCMEEIPSHLDADNILEVCKRFLFDNAQNKKAIVPFALTRVKGIALKLLSNHWQSIRSNNSEETITESISPKLLLEVTDVLSRKASEKDLPHNHIFGSDEFSKVTSPHSFGSGQFGFDSQSSSDDEDNTIAESDNQITYDLFGTKYPSNFASSTSGTMGSSVVGPFTESVFSNNFEIFGRRTTRDM